MGTIVGKGAKTAPSTITVEEYNKLEKSSKELEKKIAGLTADNEKLNEDLEKANATISELETKIKKIDNQSVLPDTNQGNEENPGNVDGEPDDDGSKKKTKKDE